MLYVAALSKAFSVQLWMNCTNCLLDLMHSSEITSSLEAFLPESPKHMHIWAHHTLTPTDTHTPLWTENSSEPLMSWGKPELEWAFSCFSLVNNYLTPNASKIPAWVHIICTKLRSLYGHLCDREVWKMSLYEKRLIPCLLVPITSRPISDLYACVYMHIDIRTYVYIYRSTYISCAHCILSIPVDPTKMKFWWFRMVQPSNLDHGVGFCLFSLPLSPISLYTTEITRSCKYQERIATLW